MTSASVFEHVQEDKISDASKYAWKKVRRLIGLDYNLQKQYSVYGIRIANLKVKCRKNKNVLVGVVST